MSGRIHSFIQVISTAPLQVHYTTQRRSRHSTDTVPEFQTEAPQATVSEGLAQGLYVAVRDGVESMTLWAKSVDSTNAPQTPHNCSGRSVRRNIKGEMSWKASAGMGENAIESSRTTEYSL